MIEMIEEEKEILDEKIQHGRFAYLLLKHKYYTNLEENFAQFNKNTKEQILRTRELEKHIVTMDTDIAKIKRTWEGFVSSVIKVDNEPINFGGKTSMPKSLLTSQSLH